MQFDEKGFMTGKTMMLLPGTACDYQTNFGSVLDALEDKYHVICVNYDGFDGSSLIFPDMFTVTQKIEQYIREHFDGRIDGAIGSSLGSSFVGQLIQRKNIHMDHGIFGSPDLDQSGKVSAWLQSKLVVPLLTGFTKNEKTANAKSIMGMLNFGLIPGEPIGVHVDGEDEDEALARLEECLMSN